MFLTIFLDIHHSTTTTKLNTQILASTSKKRRHVHKNCFVLPISEKKVRILRQ